jgi:MSHA biogenesis protein MshQ
MISPLRRQQGKLRAALITLGFLIPGVVNAQIAYYQMNEASWSGTPPQVVDSSGNGHDGTAIGGANTVSSSMFGQVGSFDGDGQYVSVGGSGTISGARTITAWIDIPSFTNYYGAPIVTGGTSGNGDFFGVSGTGSYGKGPDPDTLYVDHWGTPSYNSTVTVPLGEWAFVALTYDGANTVNFYIDGDAAGSVYSNGLDNYAIDTYTIGGATIGGTTTQSSLDGELSQVGIYDTELTSAQIRKLYVASSVPGPAAALPMFVGLAWRRARLRRSR